MLSKSERLEVLKDFRICSIVGLLPAQVNLASCKITVASKGQQWISALFWGSAVLHALYKMASFAHTFFFVPNVPLHQLVLHAVMAFVAPMCALWYYWLYIWDPSLFFSYFNITLLGNTGGPLDVEDKMTRSHWTRRIREYTVQDLIALNLPVMLFAAIIVVSAAFVYDPSMRLLLYTGLPSLLQNWATFGLCLIEEIRYIVLHAVIVMPVFQLQVISFELVSNQLRRMMETMEKGTQRVRDVYKNLRSIQVYMVILNNINSKLIFTWKLVSISMGILCGYAAIAHFSEHPVFGVMYYVMMFDATAIYTLIYQKAFKIPELFGQVAGRALLRKRGSRRDVLSRQILSIPLAGIQVGNFHTMERASTLIFVDFVLKNIVSTLVAYG